MHRQPRTVGPSRDGSRIIVAIIGLSLISTGLIAAALASWGVL